MHTKCLFVSRQSQKIVDLLGTSHVKLPWEKTLG